jgi:hypothetical protein
MKFRVSGVKHATHKPVAITIEAADAAEAKELAAYNEIDVLSAEPADDAPSAHSTDGLRGNGAHGRQAPEPIGLSGLAATRGLRHRFTDDLDPAGHWDGGVLGHGHGHGHGPGAHHGLHALSHKVPGPLVRRLLHGLFLTVLAAAAVMTVVSVWMLVRYEDRVRHPERQLDEGGTAVAARPGPESAEDVIRRYDAAVAAARHGRAAWSGGLGMSIGACLVGAAGAYMARPRPRQML